MIRRPPLRKRPSPCRQWTGTSAGIIAAALLGACAPQTEAVPVTGNLNILEPFFAEARKPDARQWVVLGAPDFAPVDAGPSLRFATTGESYVVARHVDAPLQLAPFLAWTWNTEISPPTIYPIRLAVGFRGPEGTARFRHGGLTLEGRPPLPDYDRIVEIAWGKSALERGHLSMPDERKSGPEVPVYIVRGGVENVEKWWKETVDLSELYGRLWPQDNRTATRIVFVALVADAAPRTGLRVANITLSR